MDEQALDKQFKELEQDTQVQEAATSHTIIVKGKKRITVADLKKELDELKADVDDSVLGWLGELAVRIETLETTTATLNKTLIGDVKTRLDILDNGSLSDRADVAADIAARLDNQDAAIGALADALRSHIVETAAAPQPAETEIEFAQPQPRTYGERARTGDIVGMAGVCQTMADVLLICRYLKEDPDMSDKERTEILDTACKAAGVIITPGLQIRAGVKFTGA